MSLKLTRAAICGLILLFGTPMTQAASEFEKKLLTLFEKRCAECHLEDYDPVLHGAINLAQLRANEAFVKAGDPDASILHEVTSLPEDDRDRMPRSRGKEGDPGYRAPLTSDEQELIRQFIQGGEKVAIKKQQTQVKEPADASEPAQIQDPVSERRFVRQREVLEAIHADLKEQPKGRQPFLRYLTLTNLYNQTDTENNVLVSDGQLDKFRAGISKCLNSISRNSKISLPEPIDAEKNILRIDLRDYAISQETWDTVIGGYPYGLMAIDGRLESKIEEMAETPGAHVRADWFVFAAAQPPLYHDLLNLPVNVVGLEKDLRVDVNANLKKGNAQRAGFRVSGVSQANRLIERHEIGAYAGAYWKSYDFTPLNSTDRQDLFQAPLGPIEAQLSENEHLVFKHDGGEMIFNLPNGLQAYFLSTAAGDRLSRAPIEIVQDSNRGDGIILNGISCMSCHYNGMKIPPIPARGRASELELNEFVDEVGPVALAGDLPIAEKKLVEELYVSPEDLREAIAADSERFRNALYEASPGYENDTDSVQALYNQFRRSITANHLASEFGEPADEFLTQLEKSHNRQIRSMVAQLKTGIPFPRQTFIRQFEVIAKELGFKLLEFEPIAYEEFGGAAQVTALNQGPVNQTQRPGQDPATGGALLIEVETDKEAYKPGEFLTVTFKSNADCFVRLFHINSRGQVNQIFPNEFQAENKVTGGNEVQFPDASSNFDFLVEEPVGEEVILALASPRQFADVENLRFQPEGEAFRGFEVDRLEELLTQGAERLMVEGKDGKQHRVKLARATVVYSIEK